MLLTRRQLIKYGLVGLSFGGMAACGEPQRSSPTTPSTAPPQLTPTQPVATDLVWAPPALTVNGLRVVPIDIVSCTARVEFDCATRQASAEATMRFITGAEDGCPLFDLRQTITEAWLDDQPLAVAQVASVDVGGGPDAAMRLINTVVPRNSIHDLRVRYVLTTPQSEQVQNALVWNTTAPTVQWDFQFWDVTAGCFLEMWLPANLIYDRFSIDLDLAMINTSVPHSVITNATTTATKEGWRLQWPATSSAQSPMLVLMPADSIEQTSINATLPVSGASVEIVVAKPTTNLTDIHPVALKVAQYLQANEQTTGAYQHGSRFTVWLWNESYGMEYDGATTSTDSSLNHEVFHAWYGRGVSPASQNDSWLDEAWTSYMINWTYTRPDFSPPPTPPVVVCSSNPYNRATAFESYFAGVLLFVELETVLGLERLKELMSLFYTQHRGERITTAQFEQFLHDRTQRPEITTLFARWVYGTSA